MWVADSWNDYKVIDTDGGEKLEDWGGYKLVRPDPQVIWSETRDGKWRKINAHYHRSSKGGGEWEFFDLPQEWDISYELGIGEKLTFGLKPFSFKHTGLFPEQAVNWEWFSKLIKDEVTRRANSEKTSEVAKKSDNEKGGEVVKGDSCEKTGEVGKESGSEKGGVSREVKVLNLFAYTGGATLAAAAAGAHVTHVDASKGMVNWAKENAAKSGLAKMPIRWLVDDCMKFVQREIRRGNHYDAIIMDPPSYGRGPKGEIWKIEEAIFPLVLECAKLLSEKPLFFLINSYTTGLQPAVLTYMLNLALSKDFGGKIESSEIGLPVEANGLVLPCGASGRWQSTLAK